jgi:hypothetical protein
MSYWRIGLGRSSTIVLVAATILCLHPRPIAAQDLQTKPASTDRPDAAPSSVLDEKSPTSHDVAGDSLPDASKKINLPKILPAWWVLQHSRQP